MCLGELGRPGDIPRARAKPQGGVDLLPNCPGPTLTPAKTKRGNDVTGTHWSDAKIEELKQLWAQGYSCSQVGIALGVSRNAVIGKVHRLGLPLRGPTSSRVTRAKRQSMPKPRKKPFMFNAPFGTEALRAIRQAGAPLPPPHETDIPRVSMADLQEHQCRWVVGDPATVGSYGPLFCGEKRIPGLPYCEPHARRAYQPPQPRRPAPAAPVPAKVLEAA